MDVNDSREGLISLHYKLLYRCCVLTNKKYQYKPTSKRQKILKLCSKGDSVYQK